MRSHLPIVTVSDAANQKFELLLVAGGSHVFNVLGFFGLSEDSDEGDKQRRRICILEWRI